MAIIEGVLIIHSDQQRGSPESPDGIQTCTAVSEIVIGSDFRVCIDVRFYRAIEWWRDEKTTQILVHTAEKDSQG